MVTGWPNLSNPADGIFFLILAISIILLVATTGVMVYFVFRYSKKRNPVAEDIKESLTVEIIWTVVPTVLVLVIFFAGWKGFQYMRTVPPDAMPVKVTARQWSWTFEYENGKQESVLKVPVGRPIKLLISSADVLHSLSIPAYRIKEDCVPGRQTYLWFQPDEAGAYDLFCTEYCGVSHSGMITKVEVMNNAAFAAWYETGENRAADGDEKRHPSKKHDLAPDGEKLVTLKGCVACHSIDGTAKIGPTFKGIYGKKETVIHEGTEREVILDEAFLKEKMLQPQINRIKGFPPIMPSQQGQLSDQELDAIIEYIKNLK